MHQALANDRNSVSSTDSYSVNQVAGKVADSQLLLPGSYRKHFSSLQRAAQLASNTEQCVRFLQGGLQLDRSMPEHPVFRILCRNERNQSYALLVDGLSLHLLDDTRPGGTISFAALQQEADAERERQRVLEEKYAEEALAEAKRLEDVELHRAAQELMRLENERKLMLWDYCLQELKAKAQNMQALAWLTLAMPEPQADSGNRLSFYIDFDAQDLYQQPLYYRAECSIQDKADYKLLIRPRRDSE
jgi:hypothetical protein